VASADESRKAAVEVVAFRTMALALKSLTLAPREGIEGEIVQAVQTEISRRADQIDVTDEQYAAAYEYLFRQEES